MAQQAIHYVIIIFYGKLIRVKEKNCVTESQLCESLKALVVLEAFIVRKLSNFINLNRKLWESDEYLFILNTENIFVNFFIFETISTLLKLPSNSIALRTYKYIIISQLKST